MIDGAAGTPAAQSATGPGATSPAPGAASQPRGVLETAVEQVLGGAGQPQPAAAPPQQTGGETDALLAALRAQGLPEDHPAVVRAKALLTAEGRWKAAQRAPQPQPTGESEADVAWRVAWNAEVRRVAAEGGDPSAEALSLGLEGSEAEAFAQQVGTYRQARGSAGAQQAAGTAPGAPSAPQPATVEALFAQDAYRQTMQPFWGAQEALGRAESRAATARAIIESPDATPAERSRAEVDLRDSVAAAQVAEMGRVEAFLQLSQRTQAHQLQQALARHEELAARLEPLLEEVDRQQQAEEQASAARAQNVNTISARVTEGGYPFYGDAGDGIGVYRTDATGQIVFDERGLPVATDTWKPIMPIVARLWRTFGLGRGSIVPEQFDEVLGLAWTEYQRTSDGGSNAAQPGNGQAGGGSLAQLAALARPGAVSPGAQQVGQTLDRTPY